MGPEGGKASAALLASLLHDGVLTVGEIKADLLVIASQDRRPVVAKSLVDIDRLLGSSVSDYIRVHAPAPVLLVREPEQR